MYNAKVSPNIITVLYYVSLHSIFIGNVKGMRGAYSLTRFALIVETLGITNFTWLLFACLDRLMQFRQRGTGNGVDEEEHGSVEKEKSTNNINIELGNRQRAGQQKQNTFSLLPLASPVHNCESVTV